MGIVDENIITKGFRGMYNEDLVFRRMDKQTIFSRRSVSRKPPSAGQLAARDRFNRASYYASSAIAHPQRALDYKVMAEQLRFKSAYVAAMTDYLTQPEITSVFTEEYHGIVGELITITARVPFKIIDMDVSILNAAGDVIENGKAVANLAKWRYVITTANPQVSGSKVVVSARDRQGKISTLEQVV